MERGLQLSPGGAELCLPAAFLLTLVWNERKDKQSWEGQKTSLKQSLGKSGSNSEGGKTTSRAQLWGKSCTQGPQ